MKEIDYKICQIIRDYRLEKRKNPKIQDISRRIYYTYNGTLYHLNKLISQGIIVKCEDGTYELLVKYINKEVIHMNKDHLMEMEKDELADYINLLLDTIMDLEDRLQGIYEYTNLMSFAPVIDNPKRN